MTGVDPHRPDPADLDAAAGESGLTDRVAILRCSVRRVPFADGSSDVFRPGGAAPLVDLYEKSGTRRAHGGDHRYRDRELPPAAPPDGPRICRRSSFSPAPRAIEQNGPTMDETTSTAAAEDMTGGSSLPVAGVNPSASAQGWATRAETPGSPQDAAEIRQIDLAAFPTSEEADIVEALRADPGAWIEGLSLLAQAPDGTPVGHALLTRCHVDGHPALTLAPCAVLPAFQRTGAGSAAVRAALCAARERGENLVLVLGHPEYYPRFGFVPASRFGIRAPLDVPDEAMMALTLDEDAGPAPSGVIAYPAAFGI